jgi:hypothetical protein
MVFIWFTPLRIATNFTNDTNFWVVSIRGDDAHEVFCESKEENGALASSRRVATRDGGAS